MHEFPCTWVRVVVGEQQRDEGGEDGAEHGDGDVFGLVVVGRKVADLVGFHAACELEEEEVYRYLGRQ